MTDSALDPKMDKTLVKGLAILERLAYAEEPIQLNDLAHDLGLTKSGVHRLLQTLVKLGYVSAQDGGRYAATMKMWYLGSRIIEEIDAHRTLHAFLENLARDTRETVHLGLLDGHEVIYIDMVEGRQSIRVTSQVGSRAPAHCTANGKVHLAFRPSEYLHEFEGRLARYNAKTIGDLPQLERELTKVRRDGYAINRGEWMEGICGIAAPVWNADNELAFAIGVSVPSMRFTPEDRERLRLQVTKAAAEASLALGARTGREKGAV